MRFINKPYYYRIIHESVPWLVANGRRKEAEDILQKAARFNKQTYKGLYLTETEDLDISQNTLQTKSDASKEGLVDAFKNQRNVSKRSLFSCFEKKKEKLETQYNIVDICRSRILLIYSIVMCILW